MTRVSWDELDLMWWILQPSPISVEWSLSDKPERKLMCIVVDSYGRFLSHHRDSHIHFIKQAAYDLFTHQIWFDSDGGGLINFLSHEDASISSSPPPMQLQTQRCVEEKLMHLDAWYSGNWEIMNDFVVFD